MMSMKIWCEIRSYYQEKILVKKGIKEIVGCTGAFVRGSFLRGDCFLGGICANPGGFPEDNCTGRIFPGGVFLGNCPGGSCPGTVTSINRYRRSISVQQTDDRSFLHTSYDVRRSWSEIRAANLMFSVYTRIKSRSSFESYCWSSMQSGTWWWR